MRAHAASLAALAAALLAAPAARAAYCPCFTAASPANQHDCAIDAVPGTNPSIEAWGEIFALVSRGPAAWGDAGPTVGDIREGCARPEPTRNVAARFPCELLKAITMQESGWQQFCAPDRPADQAGQSSRTIISFDCGYGVGQVTSGMHRGDSFDVDRDRVAADPLYNLATGTRILAAKWQATRCVGDRRPDVIEHWYSAAWAYNGLSYVNNPNNPNYDPGRGAWDPAIGGAAPYQEKVFGRIEHPGGRWAPTEVAYPDLGEIGGAGAPAELSDPRCATPTDCVNTRQLHPTRCVEDDGGQGGAGAGGGGGGNGGDGDQGVSTGASGGEDEPIQNGDDPGTSVSVSGNLHGSCSCDVPGGARALERTDRASWLAAVLGALVVARGRRLSRRREVP